MDRTYYRQEEDARLIEEAKYNPNRELAVVLAERFEDMVYEMDGKIGEANDRARDFERDANHLDDKVYELEHKIDVLELMIGNRDERIAELEAQLKKGN